MSNEHSIGRPVSLSIPGNVDAVHEIILKNQRIRLKHIAVTLNISYEWLFAKIFCTNAAKCLKRCCFIKIMLLLTRHCLLCKNKQIRLWTIELFYLLPKLKKHLNKLISVAEDLFVDQVEEFSLSLELLYNRCAECIKLEGDYVETTVFCFLKFQTAFVCWRRNESIKRLFDLIWFFKANEEVWIRC